MWRAVVCGVVVAYAVGGSFFLFAVCGMVVVRRLVFLFLLIFESSFWGSAFCLFGWWAFSRGWGFGGCCGMVVVPPFVSLGVHFIPFVFLYRLPRVWFFRCGVFCVFASVVFWFISVSGQVSLCPSRCVMHLSVNFRYRAPVINL